MGKELIVRFFYAAKSVKGKEKVANRVSKFFSEVFADYQHERISHDFSPEHDGISFKAQMPEEPWELMVYRAINLCQQMGRGWVLTGTIASEFDAFSNDTWLVGVSGVHVFCYQ
jgi:hypothetical protein